MYIVDSHDKVLKLRDVPQSSVGAPCPQILVNEHSILLAYIMESDSSIHENEIAQGMEIKGREEFAIVNFVMPAAFMFGPPNDEAFKGHPLAERGLKPYAAFEIENSSWLRSLERMNSVHPCHDAARFMKGRKHFIFAFHDSTLECIAREYRVSILLASENDIVYEMLKTFKTNE